MLHHSFKQLHKKHKCNKKEICQYLEFGNSLGNTKVEDYQVIITILDQLKTGCDWKSLNLLAFCAIYFVT